MLSKHLLEWGFPQKSVGGHRTDFCRWFSLQAAHENHLGLWKLFRLGPWLEILINLSGGVNISLALRVLIGGHGWRLWWFHKVGATHPRPLL